MVGCKLSAYIYTWQSNEEVEEEIAKGRNHLRDRKGASDEELKGHQEGCGNRMIFSNLVLYTISLSKASTLFKAGQYDISTAADAAKALQSLAGDAAAILFVIGIVAVGFLAVPIMTTHFWAYMAIA
jgi:Mn2+/Fe2+ NRAMP family transporter